MEKCSSTNSSNAKRRKEKENINKDQSEKDKKYLTSYDWQQTDAEVSVTLNIGQWLDVNSIVLKCDDYSCTVILPDGREWSCKFFQAVVGDGTSLQCKGSRLTLKFIKKIPRQHWQHLEGLTKDSVTKTSIMEVSADDKKEDDLTYKLEHVKHSFYEKQATWITVTLYVPHIKKETLQVMFQPRCLAVKFQTCNSKFLNLHSQSTEDTYFYWAVFLKDKVNPDECLYSLTQTVLEITLRKEDGKRWGALEAPQTESTSQSVATNTWIPVESSRSPKSNRLASGDTPKKDIIKKNNYSFGRSTVSEEISTIDSNHYRLDTNKEKPTCMVSPLNKAKQMEQVVSPGLTGLDNLGNTCFMNSVIQCLANTREFRDYFLETHFQADINTENPLGTEGKLAVAFAVLLRYLWSGTQKSYAPSKLKNLISLKASQFTGFAQHDAQEFMAFLLDGLHEDLNRIKNKPYTENIDSDGRPDEIVAEEAWELYKRRNDSIVVDLFQGQYKSKLVCPVCSKVSITFDPFLYLSVPLPEKQKHIPIIFFAKDPFRHPVKYYLKLPQESTVEHLKEAVAKKTGIAPSCLRVFEVYKSKIHKNFTKGCSLASVSSSDLIFVFEVLSEELVGEPVLELLVLQRIIMPRPVTKCSFCKRDCLPGGAKLKRCTKCYRAGYCDQSCQKNHWTTHKASCKHYPELVGCPFLISLPESQATFSKLCSLMEAFARYSVDVFQPPLKLHENVSRNSSSGLSSASDASVSQPVSNGSDNTSITSIGSSASLSSSSSQASESATCVSGSHLDCNKVHDNKFAEEKTEEKWSPSKQLIKTERSSSPKVSSCSVGAQMDTETADNESSCARIVFGQPHNDLGNERPSPLFVIRPVNQYGQNLLNADGEKLEDKGDEPLDLTLKTYLAMDWQNNEKMKNYVLVQSKELEYDIKPSDNLPAEEQTNISLHQCLQLFTEPETLAPDEAWYCPKCKAHREATKEMSLWRLPTMLIVQLKRFSFKNFMWRDKIDKMVEFPIRMLDLSPYFCGPSDNAGAPIYDLYGVINHHGGILGGHYTAYARLLSLQNTRRSEADWRLFDDSRVAFTPEGSVVTRAAYVLFYRRRGTVFHVERPLPVTSFSESSPTVNFIHPSKSKQDKNEESLHMSNIFNYEGERLLSSFTDMDSVD